jgi:hypothetical protein
MLATTGLSEFFGPDAPAKPSVISYTESAGEYTLYTISSEAVSFLAKLKVKMVLDGKRQVFVGKCKALPRFPKKQFQLLKHEITLPTRLQVAKLQKLYSKYLQMAEVLRSMQEQVDKAELEVIDELKKHGLKIKPGSPEDSQLLMANEKVRIHYRQSLFKNIDDETVSKLSKKYPSLKSCVKTRKTEYIDKQAVLDLLPHLPASVAAKILTYEPVFSFMETKLKEPECMYCGGKVHKRDKFCRHCMQKVPKA